MEIVTARYNYKKGPEKRRTGKFWALIFSVLVLVSSSGGYTYAALAKDVPALAVSEVQVSGKPAETIALPWPAAGQAAIGSLEDGVLAATENEQSKPIASMTKVITALAILEKSPLAPGQPGVTYTMNADDVAIYNQYIAKNGAVARVSAGQVLTQYQALQAVLLASANNLADSLVVRHFGSMEAYAAYANAMVKNYGLSKTVVTDASGFSPSTVSTPSELVIIGQKALQNPLLAEIVKQPQAELPGIGTIRSTNRLLSDSRVLGIKTGTTDEAGNCLLFAASHAIDEANTITIIGVVMGDSSASKVFADARSLIDAAAQNFGTIEVLPAGSRVGTVRSIWGQQVDLVTKTSLVAYGWKGSDYKVETELQSSAAPLGDEQPMGLVEITGEDTASAEVISDGSIAPPSNTWRPANLF